MFLVFIGCAFALKSLQVLHMIICQITVDIFLIDWERPKSQHQVKTGGTTEQPVSVWRTYFVANEWNELQVCTVINQSNCELV